MTDSDGQSVTAYTCPECQRADAGCHSNGNGYTCMICSNDLSADGTHRCTGPSWDGGTLYEPINRPVQPAAPTDSLPEDAGPSWLTIEEVGRLPHYREGLSPIPSGISVLDDALRGGFRPECMYIIGGRTGAAKSTLALNMARRVAVAGHSVLLLKLEESECEAVWRLHAAAAQVPMRRLLDGAQFAKEERDRLLDGWGLIRDLPIRISSNRHIDAIERIAVEHVQQQGEIIILDQLSMVAVPDVSIAYERMTETSNRLRLLARRLHVPIVAVAQVNRDAARKGERLTCNDLRDSGALENDASAILLIDKARRSDGTHGHADPLTLEILVGKNRYGSITRPEDDPLELLWWPAICRIEDKANELQTGGRL